MRSLTGTWSGSWLGSWTALFVLAAASITGAWAWLGQPVAMPPSPLAAGEKFECVSYAPFRPGQNPWMPANIEPWQIEEDLARLKAVTGCVRAYSVDHGLDKIPEIAKRHGLKVMHGLWLSSLPNLTREQVTVGIEVAKANADAIRAVIVGNEVLLRGEMSAAQLIATIREVKAALPAIPVTYADVWEFWLRNPDLANAVDFITIHILPYWEDEPIPARHSAEHLNAIRKRVVAAFPGKEVFIGEVGWPSAGRMREGALPSPVDQARMLSDVLAVAKRENFHVNVIEAFDQPWKRQLEGTVGGHWGLFDAYTRDAKFTWGAAVSNHPHWRWLAAGGVAFAAIVFAAAMRGRAGGLRRQVGVAGIAAVAGVMIGWTLVNVPIESLYVGDWARSLAWALMAALAPLLCASAIASGRTVPSFGQVIARRGDAFAFALGATFLLLMLLAVQAALGLAFDPRYRDFPFAPLTAAATSFAILALLVPGERGPWLKAETMAAGVLLLAALYVLFHEGFENWQSIWLCGGLAVLTACLLRARGARD